MNHERVLASLDDYLDGDLPSEVADAVAAHLQSCAACRRERAAQVDLRAAATALPREIEPARDLWPEIASRVAAGDVTRATASSARRMPEPTAKISRARFGGRGVWSALLAAGIAAALLIAGLRPVPSESDDPVERPSRQADRGPGIEAAEGWTAGAMVTALEAETRLETRTTGQLARHAAAHATPMLLMLDYDRAIIDRAIAELRQAYLAHPDDAELARNLARVCMLRANLDARATRTPMAI